MLTWRCRRSRRLLGLLAVAAGLNVQLAPSQTAPVTYGISDIGMLGSGSAEGHGISEFGQTLVGRAQTGAGSAYHAFALSYFGRKDLGTLGGSDSIALAASGAEIVGRARLASGAEHAFLADTYSTRPMLDLGTLGGTSSVANDLRYGYVVGASQTAGDARLQAFVYESGAMSALPVSLGGDSVAKAVSDSHDVAGYACTAGNASCRAFVLSGGALTMLGSLGGNSVANDLTPWVRSRAPRGSRIRRRPARSFIRAAS